jgi:hypothetical protein
MINEQLLTATRRMTDSRIKDMLKPGDRYTDEEVQAARIVAQERKLVSPSVSRPTRDRPMDNERPLQPIESTRPSETPISKPVEKARGPKPRKKFSYWWLIFFIYLIIKYALRAMNN